MTGYTAYHRNGHGIIGQFGTYVYRAAAAAIVGAGYRCRAADRKEFPFHGRTHKLYGNHVFVRDDGRFHVVDFVDQSQVKHSVFRHYLDHPDFAGAIKLQYNPAYYAAGGVLDKVRPLAYLVKRPYWFHARCDAYRAVPRTVTGLFWKGENDRNGRREVLDGLAGLAGDYETRVSSITYFGLMSTYRFALGLPGNGDFCYRDFEAMGSGTVLIRPEFKNATHDPLVPGVHYLAVPSGLPPDRTAAAIADLYDLVRDDDNLWHRVRDAAAGWYDRNVRYGFADLYASLVADML